VVEEEYGVSRRPIHVLHDGSDAVVAPGVCRALRASCHIGVGGSGVATADHLCVRVYCFAVIVVASEAVGAVSSTGADVEGETGEFLHYLLDLCWRKFVVIPACTHSIRHAFSTNVDRTKPIG
jgi:hypothetical protein